MVHAAGRITRTKLSGLFSPAYHGKPTARLLYLQAVGAQKSRRHTLLAQSQTESTQVKGDLHVYRCPDWPACAVLGRAAATATASGTRARLAPIPTSQHAGTILYLTTTSAPCPSSPQLVPLAAFWLRYSLGLQLLPRHVHLTQLQLVSQPASLPSPQSLPRARRHLQSAPRLAKPGHLPTQSKLCATYDRHV